MSWTQAERDAWIDRQLDEEARTVRVSVVQTHRDAAPSWEYTPEQKAHWFEPDGTPRVMGCTCRLCAPTAS